MKKIDAVRFRTTAFGVVAAFMLVGCRSPERRGGELPMGGVPENNQTRLSPDRCDAEYCNVGKQPFDVSSRR